MKLRLKPLLLAVGVFVAMLGISAGRANAASFLPHNTPIVISKGTCWVNYQHGNYISTAYAKYQVHAGASCTPGTYVKVTAYDSTKGLVSSLPCSHYKSGCASGGWIQATIPNTSLVSSQVVLCDLSGCDSPRVYNGI